jgi:hypothetical protein
VALILPPVVAGWIALNLVAGSGRRLAHLAALSLAILLVLAPWTARNLKLHRGLVPVTAVGSQMVESRSHNQNSGGLLRGISQELLNDPVSFVTRTVGNFLQFWEFTPTRLATDDPERREKLRQSDPRLTAQPLFSRDLRNVVSAVSFALELALALAGLLAVSRTRRRWALLPVSVILAYALGYALLVVKLRYRMPILPLLFLFTGAGAVALYSWLAQRADALVGTNR